MSKIYGLTAIASSAVALSGCFFSTTQPLLKSAGQDFGKGVDAASNVVNELIVDSAKTERAIKSFNLAAIPASNDAKDKQFADFACAGLKPAAPQRAAIGVLQQTKEITNSLTEDPSDKFDEVIASIEKYGDKANWPHLEVKEENEDAALNLCTARVTSAIKKLRDSGGLQVPGIAEAKAVFAELKLLAKDLEAAVLMYFQEVEWSKREQALKAFLASEDTQAAMVSMLGECARYVPEPGIVKKAHDGEKGREADPLYNVNCSGGRIDNAKIKQLFDNRIAGLMAVPYAQFLTASNYPTPAQKIEAYSVVAENLADFDALRLRQAPENLGSSIAGSYLTLRRLADGNLTDAERRKQELANLKRIVGYLKSLDTALEAIKKDSAALKASVEKLP